MPPDPAPITVAPRAYPNGQRYYRVELGPDSLGTIDERPGGFLVGFGHKLHPTLAAAARAVVAARRRALRAELARLESAARREVVYVHA